MDKVKFIVLDVIFNGNLIYCKYDVEDNEYEVKVIKNKKIYELEISVFDGRIVDIDMDNDFDDDFDDNDKNNFNINDNSFIISVEKVKLIMLDKVFGGKIVKFKYDEDDKEYEGEIIKGKIEYEIIINVIIGKILEFEIDD